MFEQDQDKTLMFTRQFGELIQARREKLGISAHQVAFMLGTDLNHYKRIERGGVIFKVEILVRLCDFYGLTLSVVEDDKKLFDEV